MMDLHLAVRALFLGGRNMY